MKEERLRDKSKEQMHMLLPSLQSKEHLHNRLGQMFLMLISSFSACSVTNPPVNLIGSPIVTYLLME